MAGEEPAVVGEEPEAPAEGGATPGLLELPEGPITEKGVRQNFNVGVLYLMVRFRARRGGARPWPRSRPLLVGTVRRRPGKIAPA